MNDMNPGRVVSAVPGLSDDRAIELLDTLRGSDTPQATDDFGPLQAAAWRADDVSPGRIADVLTIDEANELNAKLHDLADEHNRRADRLRDLADRCHDALRSRASDTGERSRSPRAIDATAGAMQRAGTA